MMVDMKETVGQLAVENQERNATVDAKLAENEIRSQRQAVARDAQFGLDRVVDMLAVRGDDGLSERHAQSKLMAGLILQLQLSLVQNLPGEGAAVETDVAMEARDSQLRQVAKMLRVVFAQLVSNHEAAAFSNHTQRYRYAQSLLEGLLFLALKEPAQPAPIGNFETLVIKPDKEAKAAAVEFAKAGSADRAGPSNSTPKEPSSTNNGYWHNGKFQTGNKHARTDSSDHRDGIRR